MSSQITQLREQLRLKLPLDADIRERRSSFQRLAEAFPPPGDISVSSALYPLTGFWLHPNTTASQDVILYVHGGGFSVGSAQDYLGMAGRIAQASQLPVLCLDYRLAPEHVFPTALQDIVDAIARILVTLPRPNRLFLIGDSAGANLAVLAAQRLRSRPKSRLAGIVCISGYFDLTNSASSIVERAHRDPFLDVNKFAVIRDTYLGRNGVELQKAASPLFQSWSGLPPLLFMTGTEEILFDDSVRAHETALASDVKSILEQWSGMIHVWPFFAPILEDGMKAISRIGKFVQNQR